MLRSMKDLWGYKVRAQDGEIGDVHDFYFDDASWTTRYLVASADNWLFDRMVLIARAALGEPDWEDRAFAVALTKEQVKQSPNVNTEQPVSRQQETSLHEHYGWVPYWAADALSPLVFASEAETGVEDADSHLRSTREVGDYRIQTADGELGHVEDFIVDDADWIIRYLVVDTNNWLPGKKVLVATHWVRAIEWASARLYVELTHDQVEACPAYDSSEPVNREYEVRLYDYYGRPKYWEGS